MLALPNDSVNAEDIRKNADWLEAAFRKRGFATRQLENDGKPLAFAEYVRQARGARTVLFYMHFDGMPVIPAQWAQKSPWIATLKQRNAGGQWEEIDRDKLKSGEIDPNWRLFARSASDDKGPIMMFLNAFTTHSRQPGSNRRSTSRCCSTARRRRVPRRSALSRPPTTNCCAPRRSLSMTDRCTKLASRPSSSAIAATRWWRSPSTVRR